MSDELSPKGGGQRPGPGQQRPAPSTSLWHLYKPGQGQVVRWGTAAGLGVMTLAFGNFLFEELSVFNNQWIKVLVPVAMMVLSAYGIFLLVGQYRKMVDFCIATEGEMKKVNWSTRREVLGATKVVIVTTIAMSFFLFLADILFILIFSGLGVVRINILGNLFGGGEG